MASSQEERRDSNLLEEVAAAKAGKGETLVAVGVARTSDRNSQSKQHSTDKEVEGKQHGIRTESKATPQVKQQTPSLEEVTQYRQTAQQNSLEAIRAAEERYIKAKEQAANAAYEAKEAAKHRLEAAAAKARQGVGATTQFISEKSVPAKEYAGEKAVQAKDTTISTTKAVAEYVGEKAVVAKDVALETGKSAAGYAGKVAEGVKDQAVVAGWGVAHKTTEIAVEATKMAGEVVGKAKDVVATAAYKAVELAEVPVVMAKDTAVGTGEKLTDYTGRKKTEAEKYKEEKHTHEYYECNQDEPRATSGGGIGEKIIETSETIKDKGTRMMEGLEEIPTQGMTEESMPHYVTEESEPGVLGAIGETLVEIAQHATELVAGPGPGSATQTQVKEKL